MAARLYFAAAAAFFCCCCCLVVFCCCRLYIFLFCCTHQRKTNEKRKKWQVRQGHPYKDMNSLPRINYSSDTLLNCINTLRAMRETLERETAHHERGEAGHQTDVIESTMSWRKARKLYLKLTNLFFFLFILRLFFIFLFVCVSFNRFSLYYECIFA